MAYRDFTLDALQERLGLEYREVFGTFDDIAPVPPSVFLLTALDRALPVVLGANREKARSELLIAPMLTEVREQAHRQISLFSGPDFKVDRKQGLSGFCDFLFSRSPIQAAIQAPVMAIVEAKHEDLNAGIPQCMAAMFGARLFNERKNHPIEIVYGATTSGTAWRFLRLTGSIAEADLTEYHISDAARILGILTHLLMPIAQ